MKSPFKFLDPYEAADHRAFFGRDAETKELYGLVTKNRLTFVYGPSGTGKTSLVQCGLATRFGGVDWLPLFVRRGEDINASLRSALGTALGQGGTVTGDIAEAIGALFNRYLRPVYLIFDQFEELFILGKNDPAEKERQPFYDTVADILNAELPCRLLFILREDYFGHLNQFEKTVPELYHRKLRVEPMSRDNLHKVVAGSCRVHDIPLADGAAGVDQILDNVLADRAGIHMPYVQVYLHMLYREALRRQYPAGSEQAEETLPVYFDGAVIRGVGPIADVLRRYLKEQDEEILQNLKSRGLDPPEDLVRRVLDPFVSEEGTKTPVFYQVAPDGTTLLQGKAAGRLSRLSPALVAACLGELEDARILRRSETDYELAHDLLAAIVAGQRSAALQQERDAYNSIEAGYREHVQARAKGEEAYFDRKRLNRLEPFLDRITLEPAWTEFLDASRAEAERLEKAETERTARELRLAQDKLAAEQKARERERFFTRVMTVTAAAAIALAVFAFFKTREANAAKDEALKATAAAERSDSLAQIEKQRAIQSGDDALLAYSKANLALLQQLEAERLARRQQLQTYLAQASDFRNRKQYGDAIAAYRSALALAGDSKTRQEIARDIARCEADKRDNDFKVAKERGLRLAEISECRAAQKYLRAALQIREDAAVREALEKCR